MKVYSLTGKSGTGKSYQAQAICLEKDICAIIDDGLFIYQDSVVSGVSAKRQSTRVGAIKTALFKDESQAARTREKIKKLLPKKILILGTSDRMVDKIAARLELPAVSERIYIEDITTLEERKLAQRQRMIEGKHVIPVPTLQLKRDFAGYFLDPMRLWRTAKGVTVKLTESNRHTDGREVNKTVVRPTFSYLGDFFISDKVLTDIAECVGYATDGVEAVDWIFANTEPDNLNLTATIKVSSEVPILETAERYQSNLVKEIELMTAFNVVRADVDVNEII
ncbi:MAG: hypothetical protein SPI74_01375 [Eubacterium sp.]|nr:hypothetical protein [Eubacterium sp.]